MVPSRHVLLVLALAACSEPLPIGRPCNLLTDAGASTTTITVGVADCICLQPSTTSSPPPTTGALCSAACSSDDDCTNAERRSASTTDHRCRGGFTCAVATTVGAQCCRRFCLCRDFLPDGPSLAPAACDPDDPVNQCVNLPGRR